MVVDRQEVDRQRYHDSAHQGQYWEVSRVERLPKKEVAVVRCQNAR